MKKTYLVQFNCIDKNETILVGGSTVELPSERIDDALLQVLLNQSALVEVEAPEVAPEAPLSEQPVRKSNQFPHPN
jgi:hypothetical protein